MENVIKPSLTEFIAEHIKDDLHRTILNKRKYISGTFSDECFDTAVSNIYARQNYWHKFPTYCQNINFNFGGKLVLEQASSEYTATYKANIIPQFARSLDLTGGLGIDSISFAAKAESHTYCDVDAYCCERFRENAEMLQLNNISVLQESAEVALANFVHNGERFGIVYIDPSRRNTQQRRALLLKDMQPNVLLLQDALLQVADTLMYKLSPLFDIRRAMGELRSVREVHIVSINNECKELLVVCSSVRNTSIKYVASNINSATEVVETSEFPENAPDDDIAYSMPKNYIYEANSSLMKLGFWADISQKYGMSKLHPNSHLWTDDNYIDDFQGRKFVLQEVVKYNKKAVLAALAGVNKANITCRNFPHSVDVVRKKLQLGDGGDYYIFATTLISGQPAILITKKV
ncbi:MAG: RsmD family RNA methyltransferase [Ignavibacteria bacterium]|nr:RsmD family RNA methyltransferase [Ignavibacteria bacterium]